MSTCADCGDPQCAVPIALGDDEPIAYSQCLERQLIAQAALLRSVTGKLEEAGGAIERVRDGLDGSDQNQWDLQREADLALRELRAVLEALS